MSTPPPLLAHQDVAVSAVVLRCLGHPLRLRILDLLDRHPSGEATVTEVWEALGVEQAVASQHLTVMTDRGILTRRKEGVHVYYQIADDRARKVLLCVRDARC
jgi:ArsR family transcriptional regulator, arsenate/arsenite/antimonite-responsive transcriptional repressor